MAAAQRTLGRTDPRNPVRTRAPRVHNVALSTAEFREINMLRRGELSAADGPRPAPSPPRERDSSQAHAWSSAASTAWSKVERGKSPHTGPKRSTLPSLLLSDGELALVDTWRALHHTAEMYAGGAPPDGPSRYGSAVGQLPSWAELPRDAAVGYGTEQGGGPPVHAAYDAVGGGARHHPGAHHHPPQPAHAGTPPGAAAARPSHQPLQHSYRCQYEQPHAPMAAGEFAHAAPEPRHHAASAGSAPPHAHPAAPGMGASYGQPHSPPPPSGHGRGHVPYHLAHSPVYNSAERGRADAAAAPEPAARIERPSELAALFQELDTNRDGKIEYREFARAMGKAGHAGAGGGCDRDALTSPCAAFYADPASLRSHYLAPSHSPPVPPMQPPPPPLGRDMVRNCEGEQARAAQAAAGEAEARVTLAAEAEARALIAARGRQQSPTTTSTHHDR